ncbi:hypothetical protein [Lysinibacillus capsici]|uniref:hypothetical protein n=1 Tax=Lysinibacillus capsici TaxID=2115968 RepID=UPI001CD9E23A|nr:hypothetical protein [Lysinibacillus capsici]
MKKVAIIDELIKSRISQSFTFENQFTHIRGFHGCRPLDIHTYYSQGIQMINKERLLHETLFRLKDTFVAKKRIIEVFEKHWQSETIEEKSIWFTSSMKELLLTAGHYMIYGSEFIQGIAADLTIHQLLKNHGIPTIFSIDVPIETIPTEYLKCLEDNIQNKDTSGGFKSTSPISKNNVIAHFHPLKIVDWHNNGEYYLSPTP